MRHAILVTLLSAAAVVSLAAVPSTGADDPPVTRRDMTVSSNNLKQIALAFLNSEATFGHFPGDILDKDGKPLLSWRVAILPFVEEQPLWMQFKMDEPWDSPANKKLIEKMPKLYAPVRVQAKAGETFYQVFTGGDALFGPKKMPKILQITDGTSNTGMVFEAGEPVIWTKPSDIPFDAKNPLPKLGGLFNGDFHVAMCDGSVKTIKKGADEQQLKYLIMPADGHPIDFAKIEK